MAFWAGHEFAKKHRPHCFQMARRRRSLGWILSQVNARRGSVEAVHTVRASTCTEVVAVRRKGRQKGQRRWSDQQKGLHQEILLAFMGDWW